MTLLIKLEKLAISAALPLEAARLASHSGF